MMTSVNILVALGAVLVSYLIGSINFAVIFSNIFTGRDVRNSGSGNAGTTNVMRTAGFLPGALTFIFDAFKGFAGAYLGKVAFAYLFKATGLAVFTDIYGAYLCYLFVMIGHILPVFFQFKGGKGIATSVGGFAVCCPMAIIIGLCAFAVSTAVSRIVSLSSLIATVFVVGGAVIFVDNSVNVIPQIVMAAVAGGIVFFTHRANIKRLIRGEEKKLTFGKSGK